MAKTTIMWLTAALWFLLPLQAVRAQKLLQIEKSGSLRTQKIPVGEVLTYRLTDDPIWYQGEIVRFLPEDSVILFTNRMVHIKHIEAFRYSRQGPVAIGRSLFWFGVGWSAFAVIGTATDDVGPLGVPDYQWSDAIVSGTTIAASWLIPRVFKYRTIRFGGKKRLRILDLDPI